MSMKDFALLSKLGQGAYSSVYKVKRLSDGNEYALKKVKLSNLSEKQIQNALNEVRILASIKNTNIISYKQAFLQGKNLCIVMEFADGGDLYQRIVQHKKKKKLFQESQIWSVIIQITKALKTLHDMQIFHRDLKSANFFLTKNGAVKLGDMNVSKMAKNGLLYTQTGTPYYASPEVWKDQPYDSKSDIWSFGCVIYEMTTLEPPFKAQDMEGLFKSVTEGTYDPIPTSYSKQLSSIIKMMLQLKPSSRPTTEKLLKSSLLCRKATELNLTTTLEQKNTELLKTIYIPKNLHYLTDRLPKSNYEVLKTVGDYIAPHRSLNQNASIDHKQRKNTLPLLGKIVRHHEGNYSISKKIKHKDSNLLIEGVSKAINDLKLNEKSIEIKRQLKRRHHGYGREEDKQQNRLPPIKY